MRGAMEMSRAIHGISPLRDNDSYFFEVGLYTWGSCGGGKAGMVDKKRHVLDRGIRNKVVSRNKMAGDAESGQRGEC